MIDPTEAEGEDLIIAVQTDGNSDSSPDNKIKSGLIIAVEETSLLILSKSCTHFNEMIKCPQY
jgi:hypothetical protein